jgi:hypothetical protein
VDGEGWRDRAILWNPVIVGGLQQCKNLVNMAAPGSPEFPVCFRSRLVWGFSTSAAWFRIAPYFWRVHSQFRAAKWLRQFQGSANFT